MGVPIRDHAGHPSKTNFQGLRVGSLKLGPLERFSNIPYIYIYIYMYLYMYMYIYICTHIICVYGCCSKFKYRCSSIRFPCARPCASLRAWGFGHVPPNAALVLPLKAGV